MNSSVDSLTLVELTQKARPVWGPLEIKEESKSKKVPQNAENFEDFFWSFTVILGFQWLIRKNLARPFQDFPGKFIFKLLMSFDKFFLFFFAGFYRKVQIDSIKIVL